MGKVKTFAELARRYLAERSVCGQYEQLVARVCLECNVVSVERVNAYIKKRLADRSTFTVKTERSILLQVWRWAYDRNLIDHAPRGVMRFKSRKQPTKAWTLDGLQALVKAAASRKGRRMRSGADQGDVLRCWVLLAYETGARFGDCWSFTKANLDGDAVAWTQAKTGDPITRLLTPACLDAIDRMVAQSPDGRILGWVCGKRQAMRMMRDLIDEVGIGGSSKWLRRSGATHCEMERPGAGRMHLGHRTPGLFESNYADWSQLRKNTPRTPAIV